MILWWINTPQKAKPNGGARSGLGILSLELTFFCARSRLHTMWLRQTSERCARTSPDDTADAGHFALRKPQSADRTASRGFGAVLIASALLGQVSLRLPEGDRLPHTSSPGPAAVASSHADFVSKIQRGHLRYREICITRQSISIIDTQASSVSW
jgi:hypothetical protein